MKCASTVNEFMARHPKQVNAIVGTGMALSIACNQLMMTSFADATSSIESGIKQMVSIVSTVIMGVGIIMAIMAIFNWVSAIHEEDSARQSKSIVRVVIAAILILIKPVSYMIINAVSSNTASTYTSDWGN